MESPVTFALRNTNPPGEAPGVAAGAGVVEGASVLPALALVARCKQPVAITLPAGFS
jgi:hypothetical protein